MFKGLIAKFMAKTLITKIIIVTSSVVVIGGATAGAIIIPKQIEIKKEEQRQEQIRLENEEDLANISIVLSREKIEIPLNGVTQGITIERYPDLEEVIPIKQGDEIKKEEMTKVLTDMFVESYTGGILTVDVDPNINSSTRGDYSVTFTVTSEKGNTKTAEATITVWNYFRPDLYISPTTITITTGTAVDIMQGVSFDSNLPEEEQGKIETTGTVDVNTVGTYTITYTYIPKEGTGENPLVENATRTYIVIEKPNVKLNTTYTMEMIENIGGEIIFISATEYKYRSTYTGGIKDNWQIGTYTVKGNKVTLTDYYNGSINWVKDVTIDNSNNTFYFNLDYENLN